MTYGTSEMPNNYCATQVINSKSSPNGTNHPYHQHEIPDAAVMDDPLHIPYLNQEAPIEVPVSSIEILCAAGLGISLGFLLVAFVDLDTNMKALVALPGELFIRAIRCLVVPTIFCILTVAVAEVMVFHNTMLLNLRTAVVFGLSSLLATIQGMIIAVIFGGFLSKGSTSQNVDTSFLPLLALQCANGDFLFSSPNGSLACVEPNATVAAGNVVDVNNVLDIPETKHRVVLNLMQQTILIIETMVPDNIFRALSHTSVIGICVFALLFGFAVAKSQIRDSLELLNVLRQARNVFLLLLGVALRFMPVAILSLMTTAVLALRSKYFDEEWAKGGYIIAGFLSGFASHVFFAMPLMVFIYTRTNPYIYMRQLLPAYVCAFGAGTSLAALPVAVAAMHQTGKVCRSSAFIIQSMGTPLNLNGPALYQPLMVVYLANAYDLELDTGKMIILFFVTWLCCICTAPVPNASFVMLGTVFETIFPGEAIPETYAFLAAVDALSDRFRTMASVHANMMCVRILAPDLESQLVASSRFVQDIEEYREPRFVISRVPLG